MDPLAQAPAALLASVEGVIFDVDDTLTTHGLLTARAFEALHRLRDAGLGAIAVTGRPLGWTDGVAAMWPIDLAVGENGAGWARREGGGLVIGTFEPDGVHGAALTALRAHIARAMPHVREASDQPARRCDVAWDIGERDRRSAADIDALCQHIEAAGARALVSSVHAHAVFGAWDKASGVMRAAEAAGIALDPERWVFVGDSGNDADAFARFPLTVGVANVRAHLTRLPVPPRFVTAEERGLGFCELVSALLDARVARG